MGGAALPGHGEEYRPLAVGTEERPLGSHAETHVAVKLDHLTLQPGFYCLKQDSYRRDTVILVENLRLGFCGIMRFLCIGCPCSEKCAKLPDTERTEFETAPSRAMELYYPALNPRLAF